VSGHETARRRAHPLVVMRAPAPAVLMMVIAWSRNVTKIRDQEKIVEHNFVRNKIMDET
jgi:hypothetical protein